MRFIYSAEHLDFIREGYKQTGIPELTAAFNLAFGLDKTQQQIKAVIKNNRFTCGRKQGRLTKGRYRSYTPEQAEFIKQGYQKWSLEELTKQFNAHFGADKTESQIRCFTRNHGIKSGRTGHFEKGQASWNTGTKGVMKPNSGSFQKGSRPVNHRPVGSERVNVEGYIEIKTAEPNVWDLKQRVVYEREHGPIPEGHNVRFRDGDRLNCEPDNLVLVDNRENALLNQRYKMNHQPLEHRDTLVLLARLDVKAARLTER